MARWYVASNVEAATNNSLDTVPNPGNYTDLDDGDHCFVMLNGELHVYSYDESSSATQARPLVVTPAGNLGNGRWILQRVIQDHKNGFPVQVGPDTDTVLSFDDGTRTLTITPTGADFQFYVEGGLFTHTGAASVVIDSLEGLHWIYFDSDGLLKSQDPGGTSANLILTKCLVATVHWDATNNTAINVGDERHGSGMAPASHHHFHQTIGSLWDNGYSLGNFSVDGTGDDAEDAQFSVSDGEFHDEDLEITVSNGAPQTLDPVSELPIYYLSGAGAVWRKVAATTYPITTTGTGRAAFNEFTGGAWQLTEVGNTDHVLVHYFATDDIYNPIFGILGQNEYSTTGQARTGAEEELRSLVTIGLPIPEWIAIATVIFQTNNGYANAVKSRIRSTDTGANYIDWREQRITGAGSAINDHESLSGLLGGGAGEHYHVTSSHHTDLTHNKGIIVRDTTGLAPEVVLRSDTDVTHGRLGANLGIVTLDLWDGADWEYSFAGYLNGHIELYYNNLVAALTSSTGMIVRGPGGVQPTLNFQSQLGTDHSRIISTATDTGIHLWNGVSWDVAFKSDVGGSSYIYHDGLLSALTDATGFIIRDLSGSAASIIFQSDAGVDLGRVLSTASVLRFQLWNGAAHETVFSGNLGGSAELYFDGVLEAETFSNGLKATNSFQIGTGTSVVTSVLDEDTMVSDSDEALATQQSIKAYVDSSVTGNNSTNILINGRTDIWQRATSVLNIGPGATNVWVADRFKYDVDMAVGELDYTRSTDVPTPPADGSDYMTYSIKLQPSVADTTVGASEYGLLATDIEGFTIAPFIGQTVTLSFWIKSFQTGVYCVALRSTAGDVFIHEFTVNSSATWERKELTLSLDSTSFSSGLGYNLGMTVSFVLSMGTDFHTATPDTWETSSNASTVNQINFYSSLSNYVLLTDIRLVKGTSTDSMVVRPIGQELSLCQRYFEKSYLRDVAVGTGPSTPGTALGWAMGSNRIDIQGGEFREQKAVTPTIAIYNPTSGALGSLHDYNNSGTTYTFSSITGTSHNGIGSYITLSSSPGSVKVAFHWTAEAELS